MMRHTRGLRRLSTTLAWTVLTAGLVLSACGSSDSGGSGGERGAEGGEGGEDGEGLEPDAGSPGAVGGESTGGSGARGGEGTEPDPGSAGEGTGGTPGRPDLEPGEDGPGYDGVDLDALDLTAPPQGCAGGFDPELGTLSLTLDDAVPVVLIQIIDGALHANGTPCDSAAGDAASIDGIRRIDVAGGTADETVYVESAASFATELLSNGDGFVIDLGAGSDELVLLGSDDQDDVAAGSSGDTALFDFSGDGEREFEADGVESVLISSGPESDVIRCDGARLGVSPLHVPARLYGGGANDVLSGGASEDELFGGIGNDSLSAGALAGGADVYDGGDGTDEVDYSLRSSAVSVTLAGAADDGEADERDDVHANVENVAGSRGPNLLTGSELANDLRGGAADDVISGGPGSDALSGGDGEDVLEGGDGDDQLYGESGDDELRGGPGDDIVDGVGGRDVIDGGAGDGDICSFTSEDAVTSCEL